MIAGSCTAETGDEPPDAPASPDPRLRDRGPAALGAARPRHCRRVAAAMVELGRPGVSPPSVERGRAGCVLRPVRSAGAHGAQRLGLPLGSRGDGFIEPEGRVRPSDRRARRRRIAVAFRPVLHGPTGDRCGPLRARTAAGGRRDLLGRSARCLWRDAAATRDASDYAHEWRVGDLVLWDNGFTMHRRTPFDPGARRLMKRMTLHLDPKRHVMPDGALAESGTGMPV